MTVYIRGRPVTLDPRKVLGKGGEADIYDIGGDRALKLYKPTDHPDLYGQPLLQVAAQERLALQQRKLPAFPAGLPDRVVTPSEMVTDERGQQILGYVMPLLRNVEPLLRYSERSFRDGGVPSEAPVEIFRDLALTVNGLHRRGVVIADFNDLNVLISNHHQAYLVDADSLQYGGFLSGMYTVRFVDPLLCILSAGNLQLAHPHNEASDWYAFRVMLMQSLLYVDPYGGVYRPTDLNKRMSPAERLVNRVTVFQPEVRYPKPALPYALLPDALLQDFHEVFVRDRREPFPVTLLNDLRWTTCRTCGLQHARPFCPECARTAKAAVKSVIEVRGQVTSRRVFKTRGQILFAAYQSGELRWLYHDNGQYCRESGETILKGDLDPKMRYRLQGAATILGREGQLVTLRPNSAVERQVVDSFGSLPIFAVNERRRYWLRGGQLLRNGQFGEEYIGEVLAGQTLLWVGDHFGFGFYRAGGLQVAFVFDGERRGLNDTVQLPWPTSQLIDSTAVFGTEQCWFLTTVREGGETVNHCAVIGSDGQVKASAATLTDDGSWLGTIRGKGAVGNYLLSATDEGVVRIEMDNGQLAVVRRFPDTEPFVNARSNLFPGVQGLYAVDRNEIRLLQIATKG